MASTYPSEIADVLIELFISQEEEIEVRRAAALALGEINEDRVINILIEAATRNKNERLVFPCIVALGQLASPKAVDTLIQALQMDKTIVPQAAAKSLGQIGPSAKKAIPVLKVLEKEGNEVQSRSAHEAIAKIQDK